MAGGTASMPDYEILELLLYGAIRQGDTKPLAKRLMDTFGSLADVLSAPPERLAEVKGVDNTVAATLKIAREAGIRLVRAQALNRPILSSWSAFLDYCQVMCPRFSRHRATSFSAAVRTQRATASRCYHVCV